jgi:hypothetical protein
MMIRWGIGAASALAAAIVMAVMLHRPGGGVVNGPAVMAKGDVNGDGVVNMVDALALARHVRAGDRAEKGWDVNGDGVVDARDADAVAVAAVSLKQSVAARRGLPTLRELGIDRGVVARGARDARTGIAAAFETVPEASRGLYERGSRGRSGPGGDESAEVRR